MKQRLEELIKQYLEEDSLLEMSDTRFKAIIDLYKELQKQPSQDDQAEIDSDEVASFIEDFNDTKNR